MRAGPTGCGWRSSPPTGEHPRGCGADPHLPQTRTPFSEASPRVRGRPDVQAVGGLSDRSIPARAGPTGTRCGSRATAPEHPRGCGADSLWPGHAPPPHGASPRVRGRPPERRPPCQSRTGIPAGAGPTHHRHGRESLMTEHPRGCGADSGAAPSPPPGASPRVRGRPVLLGRHASRARSIPARAGPTSRSPGRSAGRPEHPRACGADEVCADGGRPAAGASPRVRGRLEIARRRGPVERSIPAGAGPTGL